MQSTALSFTISNLQPSTPYVFHNFTVTPAGKSEPASLTINTLSAGKCPFAAAIQTFADLLAYVVHCLNYLGSPEETLEFNAAEAEVGLHCQQS